MEQNRINKKDFSMNTPGSIFSEIIRKRNPKAIANISGNAEYPDLKGTVKFYKTPFEGVLVEAEIYGLPNIRDWGSSNYYAMHIHENGDCTRPFDKTGPHYSRVPEKHPFHSGDMMPLLGNQGYAWEVFYDSRITVQEINGRSVIIHAKPDDFTTQPSGNSGEKIGCGVIHLK